MGVGAKILPSAPVEAAVALMATVATVPAARAAVHLAKEDCSVVGGRTRVRAAAVAEAAFAVAWTVGTAAPTVVWESGLAKLARSAKVA